LRSLPTRAIGAYEILTLMSGAGLDIKPYLSERAHLDVCNAFAPHCAARTGESARRGEEGRSVTVIDVSALDVKEPREGWQGRFFHSSEMTFAYYTVDAGAWIHEHSHPNDEVWNVIDGRLEITIAGETQVVGPGCAAVVPPETAHSLKALTAARAIVVDHPRRYSIGGIEL
jgi:quercetin dioxygenase-like cupin family protein